MLETDAVIHSFQQWNQSAPVFQRLLSLLKKSNKRKISLIIQLDHYVQDSPDDQEERKEKNQVSTVNKNKTIKDS